VKKRPFSDVLKDDATHIWERIFSHPFLIEMHQGKLPLDKFIYYVKQDYIYLFEFARCLAIVSAKVDDRPTMRNMASRISDALTFEVEMLRKLGEEMGLSIDQLEGSEPAPTNFAYTRHLLYVAYSGTVGENMAAMLPCMWIYQEMGDRIGRGEDLSGQSIYYKWCSTYRSPEYKELVKWYRNLTDRFGSESGTNVKDKMKRHFILSSRYEYMFWDMAYRKEVWPV